eukprot:SAG11_NODE_16350_length_550_cov_0.687361_2_plen_37_part_01
MPHLQQVVQRKPVMHSLAHGRQRHERPVVACDVAREA